MNIVCLFNRQEGDAMDKCKECEHFYECDNMGYYEECKETETSSEKEGEKA